jgi:hypothetical protein
MDAPNELGGDIAMRLTTRIRPFTDANLMEGTVTDPQREEWAGQVRKARLEVARGQKNWEEIPETRLVQRGRYLVDAETDLVYVRRRGVVFETGNATVGYVVPGTPMTYTVNEADEVVFLELGSSRTWSEIVERKARRAT